MFQQFVMDMGKCCKVVNMNLHHHEDFALYGTWLLLLTLRSFVHIILNVLLLTNICTSCKFVYRRNGVAIKPAEVRKLHIFLLLNMWYTSVHTIMCFQKRLR